MERKVTVEQFEVDNFSATKWFNTSIGSQEKLDKQAIDSLQKNVQKLCREISESVETSSNQLTARLPATAADIGALKKNVAEGHGRLIATMGRLEGVDRHDQWQDLSEVDEARKRIEIGKDALREINQWDRRIKDLDATLRSGSISKAMTKLLYLQKVCEALRVLPEHEEKEQRLKRLEVQLFAQARQKAFFGLEKSDAAEIKNSFQFFEKLGQPEENGKIIAQHFKNVAHKLLGSRNPFEQGMSGALMSQTLASFFDGLAQEIKNIALMGDVMDTVLCLTQPLQVLNARITEHATSGEPGAAATSPDDKMNIGPRFSRASAAFSAYAEGFEQLHTAIGGESWRRLIESKTTLVPTWILCDVTRFGILSSLRSISEAHAVKVAGSPTDAIFQAESVSRKWMQEILTTAVQKAKDSGYGSMTHLWLACLDVVGEEYWSRWSNLVEAFGATMRSKSGGGFNATLLSSCIQFYDLLEKLIKEVNTSFTQQTVQNAVEMRGEAGDAWTVVVESIDLPNEPEIPTATAISNAKKQIFSADSKAFPLMQQTMIAIRRKAHYLVIQCCITPIHARLENYEKMKSWTDEVSVSSTATVEITSMGEDLFALAPMLEQYALSGTVMQEWLSGAVSSLCDIVVSKALQIPALSLAGTNQLICDLDYVHQVVATFDSEANDLVNLKNCLEKLIDPQKGLLKPAEQKFENKLKVMLRK